MITKQTDANAVAVAKEAKKQLELAMKELPSDIKFQIISDNSDFIVKVDQQPAGNIDVRFDLCGIGRISVLRTMEGDLYHCI